MGEQIARWPDAARRAPTEAILESRYGQLLKWGEMLARGDRGIAQEVVQDLCLQLTLSKPDFSEVGNLDGYLYTCLRHVYLSRLARASREAGRFVGIAECDSLQFALDTGQRVDSLEIQNALRRICRYSAWRKEFSKNFSYFILHFFHGYFHREIGELACAPMAAIYSKLNASRTELKAHLGEPGKLRFPHREAPPEAVLSWTAVSSAELFGELRRIILDARQGECASEEELLSWYTARKRTPLPCSLLAHIVSCERCMALIDRHLRRPTLKDRDFLDGLDRSLSSRADGTGGGSALESIKLRRRRVYEHRPSALSIAANGKIVASHEVEGESSLLSVRIERPEDTRFVEVFCEHDIRLAILSIEISPPEGPHRMSQRIPLSDDRWLDLSLAFDGLGLNGEVAYFDPILALDSSYEEPDASQASIAASQRDQAPLPGDGARGRLAGKPPSLRLRLLRRMTFPPVLRWAFVILCLVCGAGYLAYRYIPRPLDATAILNRSIRTEAASLQGRTEHEELSFEQVASDGRPLAQGKIDQWKESGSGKYIRRLYDSRHHLVAAEWQTEDGTRGSHVMKSHGTQTDEDRQLAAGNLWTYDVSSQAFKAIAQQQIRIGATKDGYQLTADVREQDQPQLVSATLVLNRHLMPVGETLWMRSGSTVREVRYMRTEYETKPSSSVPESVFNPDDSDGFSPKHLGPSSSIKPQFGEPLSSAAKARLVALQIGVLYTLDEFGADTGEPIQVIRTPDERIRLTGTVSGDSRKHQIDAALESLPDHRALELRLVSRGEARASLQKMGRTNTKPETVYNIAATAPPADAALRAYFEDHKPSGESIDAAIAGYERSALGHAQRALQQAYALDRLGSDFSPQELRAVDPVSRRRWAEMASSHASALKAELRALRTQLARIEAVSQSSPAGKGDNPDINNPAEFAHEARLLLKKTQSLNTKIGFAFASGSSKVVKRKPDAAIAAAADAIPLAAASNISQFAAQLTGTKEKTRGGDARAYTRIPIPPR